MNDESGAWLTYAEAGDRLGITPEAARSRAKRLGWRRQLGNDGRALVWAALEPRPPGDQPVTPRSPPGRMPDINADAQLSLAVAKLVSALEAHVETLKAQLAAAEARIDKQAEDLVAYDAAYASGLTAERAKVEAERAKAERACAEFAARDAQHAAELKAEQEQTAKAITAFSALAERLDALAAGRRRRWWQRLVGQAARHA
jgi:hypothetical protein